MPEGLESRPAKYELGERRSDSSTTIDVGADRTNLTPKGVSYNALRAMQSVAHGLQARAFRFHSRV